MRNGLAAVLVAVGLVPGWAGTAAPPAFPPELVEFGPPSAEPLFSGGGPDTWDRDLRERGWIERHGDRWRLWYTGSNPDRDPVRRVGVAFDQIVKYGGRYYAYYHASPAADRGTWQTCIATSMDLVRWEKWAGNPLLPVDPAHPKRSSATLVFDGERHRLYTTHPDVRVRFSRDRVGPAGR